MVEKIEASEDPVEPRTPRGVDTPGGSAQAADPGGTAGAQAVVRAGRLMLAVAQAGPGGVRLSALAAALSLPHPTVHRMLTALGQVGALQRLPGSNRWLLGEALGGAPSKAVPREVLQHIVRPALLRLATRLGENVFLSVRDRCESVCIDRLEGSFPVRFGLLDIGVRRPLGVGAASLALLAALPDDAVEDALRVNRAQLTGEHTPARLRRLVRETRQNGYAFDGGRLFASGRGLGLVITTGSGAVVGAISVGAFAERMPPERVGPLAAAIQAEIRLIAAALDARAQLAVNEPA